MATPIVMPKEGNSVEECLISRWTKQVGDKVAAGDVLAEIETDKTTAEVTSNVDGTFLGTFFDEGDLAPVLVNVCVIGEEGESIEEFRPAGDDDDDDEEEVVEEVAEAALAAAAAPVVTEATVSGDAAPMSPRAKRFLEDHPYNVGITAGSGAGGRIMEKDLIADYNNSNRMSPVAAAMQQNGVATPAGGTGVAGMITSGDMGKVAEAAPVAAAAPAAAAPAAAPVENAAPVVTKLSNIRKIIATRMVESLTTTAQYTLNMDADATAMMALRKRLKAAPETIGLSNVSLNDMVMYAVVKALKLHPEINGEFTGKEVITYSNVNLAFACDTERGLMVPVIPNAENMSMAQIKAAVRTKADSAMSGTISPEELSGGTFTVSNLGAFGVTGFTPVLNPPQLGILGVCGIQLKPVRVNGEVEFRDMMSFSLTLNHQVIDGAPGARFLKTLKEIIENIDLVAVAG